MKTTMILFVIIAMTTSLLNAQSKKEQDITINQVTYVGVTRLTFSYTETFSPDTNYVFHMKTIIHMQRRN